MKHAWLAVVFLMIGLNDEKNTIFFWNSNKRGHVSVICQFIASYWDINWIIIPEEFVSWLYLINGTPEFYLTSLTTPFKRILLNYPARNMKRFKEKMVVKNI